LKRKYGQRTEEFLAAFEKVYSNYQPKDLLDVDFMFRPLAVNHASLKYGLQGAPVYTYLFAWESPILDGMLRSTHCMELPFVFNNIELCKKMTGGGEQAHELADKMSSSWLSFAKTGDPNTAELPHWEPYSIDEGATMVFDKECDVKYNHDKELLQFINSFNETK
jgi:para-nitrobenzyl esterase